MRRTTPATPPDPLPLDYAGPREDRSAAPDGMTFRAAVSGLLVIGLAMFGGGLAALITRSDGYGMLLIAGSVLVVPFLVLRIRGR
jgi:hypothetical protein